MATSREQARAELRRSIDVLPERTRKAMLHGLGNNTVITGAFAASGRLSVIVAILSVMPNMKGPWMRNTTTSAGMRLSCRL